MTAAETRPLPTGSIGTLSNGYWGAICFIMTEATLFTFLLFSYFYQTIQPHTGAWPSDGKAPSLTLALPNTFLLLASSAAVWFGERASRRGARFTPLIGLVVSFIMGVTFVIVQVLEWRSKTFSLTSDPYGSLFFTVTGFHMAHVIAGLMALFAVIVWTALGYFDRVRNAPVTIAAIYWHFVDAVWLVVFFSFYLTPRLGLLWNAQP